MADARPSRMDEDYVCIQCGPDPRGGDKHAWYRHTIDGLSGEPYPYEDAKDSGHRCDGENDWCDDCEARERQNGETNA